MIFPRNPILIVLWKYQVQYFAMENTFKLFLLWRIISILDTRK